MVTEHGECPRPRGCGEPGIASGRGIDVLAVNDPWAKEVENTSGQDRIVTADKMDEGQESTEKVEKTGEFQEGFFGLHQKMDQLLAVAKHTSSFAGKSRRRAADLVERPWDSTPLQEAARFKKPVGGAVVRWRPEGFGFVKVDGADVFSHVSVVRGPLEGLVGCKVVVFLEVDAAKKHRQRDEVLGYQSPPRAGLRRDLGEDSSRRGSGGGRARRWRGQAAGGGFSGRHGEGHVRSVASPVESSTRLVGNEDGRHGRADQS